MATNRGHRLTLDNITQRFNDFVAVRDINLDVAGGELVTLLGPSGCGKSTLLRIMSGFIRQTEGRVLFDGEPVDHLTPSQRGVGIVFQNYALFPHMSVTDNVAYGLHAHKWPREKIAPRVAEMLALVHMGEFAARKPRQLSGGQQQRIALARSLITEPQVLLLDEPLSALDPFLRVRMREELKRLQRELGITFIHVTHSQDEAMALADLMVVMDEGRIRQAGTPREIFEKPASAFIARFIGGHNVVPTAHGVIAVRADRCRIGPPGSGPYLSGRVVVVEYQGPVVRVALETQSGEQAAALLPDDMYFAGPVQPGDPATLVWSETDAHQLDAA
jgi:putative spermidine/putrescine transport system ATP-binding protein